MVRGDLVKLFLRLDTKSVASVKLAKAFGVNCRSDAQAGWNTITLHAVASPFSLRFARDTRVSPGPDGEDGFEEGD